MRSDRASVSCSPAIEPPARARQARSAARRASDGRLQWLVFAGLIAIVTMGCRQDMYNQWRTKPLSRSDFFADTMSARMPVPGTIARGQLEAGSPRMTGIGPDGAYLEELPMPLTPQVLARGHERFDVFCSPCHGRTGDGRGMIVQRGFKQPSSYHTDRLRSEPVGYFFHIATDGFGQMGTYAPQVPVDDRWAIAAYVRVLQVAHAVAATDLTDEDRAKLEAGK